MLTKAHTPTLTRALQNHVFNRVSKCRPTSLSNKLAPINLLFLSHHRSQSRLRSPCILRIAIDKRAFSNIAMVPVLTPPLVFVGLVLTLWIYKCCMMIIFQNKIIYMPSVPPFSRREKISDYARMCGTVEWEERRISSLDGTQIALCIGRMRDGIGSSPSPRQNTNHVVILYFQGNASSLPPRLPALSKVLMSLNPAHAYTLVALSYRGFWTSRGRASQEGIEMDADAAIAWVQTYHAGHLNESHLRLILWGQSIGAAVAAGASSRLLHSEKSKSLHLSGLVLETPFVSIKRMLTSLYPQKWLPYRYLWPFLRNRWDNEAALRTMSSAAAAKSIPIFLITAGRDEIVPSDQADDLQLLCQQIKLTLTRYDVHGALHTEVTSKPDGRDAVVTFINAQGSSGHKDIS